MKTDLRPARPEKVAVVDEVRERFASSNAAILTEYRGLGVSDLAELRRSLAAAGSRYKVYKNTLVRRAAEANGLGVLEPLLVGPTAIAFVEGDVAAVAKILRDFARTHPNLVVKGGLVGSSLLDARSTTALADLPSRETLLSQIAGALAAPMQQFAALLQAVPQKFAYALSALIDERGGLPAAEEALAVPEEAEAPAAVAADGDTDAASSEPVATEPAAESPAAEAPAAESPAAESPAAGDDGEPGDEIAGTEVAGESD